MRRPPALMSRVKVVTGASVSPAGRTCAGSTSGARLKLRRWPSRKGSSRVATSSPSVKPWRDLRLERLQAAAGFDQHVGDQAVRADRVGRDRAAGGEHDVGAVEADDHAGERLLPQIDLGGLSLAERACESGGHI